MSMKRCFLYVLKLIVSCLISICVLNLFAAQYHYFDIRQATMTKATDFVAEPNQIIVNRSEGFAVNKMDENGYNNPYQVKNCGQIDILLIGSSHVVGEAVSPDNNQGYILNEILPDLYTYSIAQSGHYLYSCVKNVENAVQAFPAKYVVMETGMIDLDFDAMEQVCTGEYPNVGLYHGAFTNFLNKYIPIVRLFWNNIDEWMSITSESTGGADDYNSLSYGEMLNAFLSKAASATDNLIIYYHPSTDLDSSGKLIFDTNSDALNAFRNACENNGIIFVDMTDDFKAMYYEDYHLPYGFSNTRLGRGHMNAYGDRAIAERLAEVITILEEQEVK